MITIDQMEEMLEQIAAEFPEPFYEKLNGGICLLPEAKRSEHSAKHGALYILGEYHYNVMGRYIYIYYGSFRHVHGHLSKEGMYRELKKTIAHEFTHHLENLAGERGLEIKDEEDLERYLHGEDPP